MFRIALTPCSPARRTRMYQLRCQSGLGRRGRGPGGRTCPAVRGESGRVGGVRDARAAPGAWVARWGRRGPGPPHPLPRPKPTLSRRGRGPCVEGAGVTVGAAAPCGLLCPLPRGPRPPRISHRDARFSRSPTATRVVPGREGEASSPAGNRCAAPAPEETPRALPALPRAPGGVSPQGFPFEAQFQIITCSSRQRLWAGLCV